MFQGYGKIGERNANTQIKIDYQSRKARFPFVYINIMYFRNPLVAKLLSIVVEDYLRVFCRNCWVIQETRYFEYKRDWNLFKRFHT
jgi:hypothetical protein